jgi:hypothetical protein
MVVRHMTVACRTLSVRPGCASCAALIGRHQSHEHQITVTFLKVITANRETKIQVIHHDVTTTRAFPNPIRPKRPVLPT